MSLNKDYINRYIEIKTLDGDIITSGKIINLKNNVDILRGFNIGIYLSTDNKYFFNLQSKNFIIKISFEFIPDISTNVDLIKNLNVKDWMKFINHPKLFSKKRLLKRFPLVDVFTDKTIDEADAEIKDFLYFLNTIYGITTTSSCCGHAKMKMYISFGVDKQNSAYAIEILQKMLFILHKLNLGKIITIQLDYDHFLSNDYNTDRLMFEFKSIGKGNKEVWEGLKKFQTFWETFYE